MRGRLRARFLVELALSFIAFAAVGAAVLVPDWIELILGVDPDQGSGAFEWALGLVALGAIALALAARADWRRLRSLEAGRAEG